MSKQTGAREVHVGVAIVTHVDYGAALLRAAEQILGPAEDCTSIQVDINLDVNETVTRLKEAVSILDTGMGVIILTDMFGGTPTNLSLSILGDGKIEVLTGVNLPMLLKILSHRTKPIKELAEMACETGRGAISSASDILRNKRKTEA